jgi:FkbM family methyltransferase
MSKSKIGGIIKRFAPSLYERATKRLGKILSHFADSRPFLTDSLGGDFKSYINQTLSESRFQVFKKGFDAESLVVLDTLVSRFHGIPNQKLAFKTPPYVITNLLPIERNESSFEMGKRLGELSRKFKGIEWEESVGYFNHGLFFVPPQVKSSLINAIGLDIGSFVGDSALMLEEVGFNEIISFDISQKSTVKYVENVKKFARNPEIFKHELKALSDENAEAIRLTDDGSAGMSVVRKNSGEVSYEVQITTVDSYCENMKIKPGFIKADMEGFAFKMIQGARKTIEENKPVLCLAVYHNPEEFFEIKLLLQELVPSYKFLLRKLTPKTARNHCHSEVFLIVYHED